MHPVKIPSQDEVLQVFRRAGFTTLTPLQEKLIPALLRGRDVAVEASAGSGRTVGFVLPLILGLRGAGLAPHALVLCAAPEDVGKVARAVARVGRVVRDAPAFVPLGEIEDARREQRRLEKGATIVAGTTERVIDHVRRGSLPFDRLSTVVLTAPEGPGLADFVKDVQFIFAKMEERRQTILFSPGPLTEENDLLQFLRHPIVLGAGDMEIPAPTGAGHLFIPVDAVRAEDRPPLLARVILGMRIPSAVVYHSPRSDARAIAEALRQSGLRAAALTSGPSGARGQTDRRSAVLALSRKALDVLLVPLGTGPGTPELQEASPSHVVFYEGGGARPAPGRVRPGATLIALVDQGQEKDIARFQEAIGVTMNRGQIPSDDEVLTGAIDRILKRIGEEDRTQLVWLRSRIRRQVPLLLRPLFMAALLKAQLPPLTPPAPARALPKPGPAEQPRTGQPRTGQPRPGQPRPGLTRPAPSEAPPGPRGRFGRIAGAGSAAPRPPRPETRTETRGDGQFAQLFVSIGRNRRVYARDLSALFTEKLALAAGDIGGVRVFEKYSFVDIAPSRAEEAIAKLSGTELKGRTITVNYAKKKEGKEGA